MNQHNIFKVLSTVPDSIYSVIATIIRLTIITCNINRLLHLVNKTLCPLYTIVYKF